MDFCYSFKNVVYLLDKIKMQSFVKNKTKLLITLGFLKSNYWEILFAWSLFYFRSDLCPDFVAIFVKWEIHLLSILELTS